MLQNGCHFLYFCVFVINLYQSNNNISESLIKITMKNNSFLDYRIPTSLDLPMIDPIIIEVNNPNHPFGVKGVGESNIVPPLAAISHAVFNATGKRVYELPMNPESISRIINEKL